MQEQIRDPRVVAVAAFIQARYPDQFLIPLVVAAQLAGESYGGMRNRLMYGRLGIKVVRRGERNFVAVPDLVQYIAKVWGAGADADAPQIATVPGVVLVPIPADLHQRSCHGPVKKQAAEGSVTQSATPQAEVTSGAPKRGRGRPVKDPIAKGRAAAARARAAAAREALRSQRAARKAAGGRAL